MLFVAVSFILFVFTIVACLGFCISLTPLAIHVRSEEVSLSPHDDIFFLFWGLPGFLFE